MDVMRAEAEVSRRDQDLTVAKTNLQLQESLIKNALTKNLDDPVLESMPVIPTDRLEPTDTGAGKAAPGSDHAGVAGPSGVVGVADRSAEPPDQPQGGQECVAADAGAGGLLRRHRPGRRIESVLLHRAE